MKSIKVIKGEPVRQVFSDGEDLSVELAEGALADLLIVASGERSTQSVRVSLDRDSVLNLTVLDATQGDMERSVEVSFNGAHGLCRLNGVFVTSSSERVANYIKISHLAEGCESFQNFRGVASDSSRGFFRGYIYVDKDAQETVAMQENHNILLSDKAKIETQPQLEIYADRVKCNHGATIGRQDEAAMFYCRQRGIESVAARALLIEGFCRAALPVEGFGAEVEQQVFDKLAQKLTQL